MSNNWVAVENNKAKEKGEQGEGRGDVEMSLRQRSLPADPRMDDPNTRTIFINNPARNLAMRFADNRIRTTKYTIITFLPKNLFHQFKRFANFFYLIVSVLSCFKVLWDNWVGNVIPLAFVLAVTAVKEIAEDYRRYKSDEHENSTMTEVLVDGRFEKRKWKELRVGDLVRLNNKERIPADIVVLSSTEEGGKCYIETANLDGETNSKLREAIRDTSEMQNASDLQGIGGYLQCAQPFVNGVPQIELYKFEGAISISKDKVISVSVDNVLLRGSVLRNTHHLVGLVVYTGSETKLMLNSSEPPIKRSNVERLMNQLLYAIFAFLMGLCITAGIGSGIWSNAHLGTGYWYITSLSQDSAKSAVLTSLTSIIAFSFIIPISLYVSMEIVKLSQTFFMDNDLHMYHEESDTPCNARTSNLNEELGQIAHIFSDKTGTLTCNRMDFRRCSIAGEIYGEPIAAGHHPPAPGPSMPGAGLPTPTSPLPGFDDNRLIQRCMDGHPDSAIIVEFLRILSLCHTVVPEQDGPLVHYNAQSPDEAALVKAARGLGFVFESRGPDSVTISALGNTETYKVLNTLDFNSDRKRMSVVLRTEAGKILLFCKGADSVILELLAPNDRFKDVTTQHLDTFAVEGLRTLCLAAKELKEEEWEEWNKGHEIARTAVHDREEKVGASSALIEKNLTLLGATAIEDKLQEGVPETIQQMYKANIKVWMLTGDKQETAINIGYSCRLLYSGMRTVIINQRSVEAVVEAVNAELSQLQADPSLRSGGLGVVIDGTALAHALQDAAKLHFLKLAELCEGVICCRVSPKQKALVVRLVKDNVKDAITLAIGDGANDVPMIQEAHVGVGISGLEGMQAVMASDYAIAQFRFLERLLLVHGRYSYRRIARLILYSFHKNLLFTLPQFYFFFYTGFSGTTLYETQAGSLFNVLFSTLPILALGIFEIDVPANAVLQYPQLYSSSQRGQTFNLRRHAFWSLSAIVQSFLVFFSIMAAASDPRSPQGLVDGLYVLGATAYCVVVFCVNFKIAQITSSWNWIIALCTLLTLIVWFPFMALAPFVTSVFPDLWGVLQQTIILPVFWLLLGWNTVVCLVVDHCFKAWKRNYFPEPFHIVQEIVQAGMPRPPT